MSRVYVGNLPNRVDDRDVEDVFYKFGRIRDIDVKFPARGAPFAFVEFDDERDADEAVYRRSGYEFHGCRLRVEIARGGRGGRGGGRDDRGRGPPRRSDFRVIVTGLPKSASWQDLKDHMRRGGEVGYANVFGDGSGVVEYGSYEDMRDAIRKLDDSEFRNPFDKKYIRVREDRGKDSNRRRSRSRSPSNSRSRSPHRRRKERRSRSGSKGAERKDDGASGDKKDDDRRRSRSASASKHSKASRGSRRSRSPSPRRSRSPSPRRSASPRRSRSPSNKSSGSVKDAPAAETAAPAAAAPVAEE